MAFYAIRFTPLTSVRDLDIYYVTGMGCEKVPLKWKEKHLVKIFPE